MNLKPRMKLVEINLVAREAHEAVQGYMDIYSPFTLKCTQEFLLVTVQSYSALTTRQNITISHVKKL